MFVGYLPLAAKEINACACLRTFSAFTSGHFLFLIGNRISSNSKKSCGVTDDISHFSLLRTHNSQCWKTKERKPKIRLSLTKVFK